MIFLENKGVLFSYVPAVTLRVRSNVRVRFGIMFGCSHDGSMGF